MKLNTKNVVYASLAFGWITIFWFGYDNLIQTINISTFGLRTPVSGLILAIDNILGLFLLPLFGWLSDKSTNKHGKRTPFIIAGTVISLLGFIAVGFAAYYKNLTAYILSLILTLFAMAAYRSPALALVPDITPEPLRSRANAISNVVSALFNVVAIAIVTPLLTEKYIQTNNYLPIIAGIVISSIITMFIFLKKVNEPRFLKEYQIQLDELNLEQQKIINDAIDALSEHERNSVAFEQAELDRRIMIVPKKHVENIRNKLLILLCVFFFYMAYNALVSNFANYARFVLGLSKPAIPLVVTMVGALIGFIPATKYAGKHSRKRAIFLGFVLMGAALLIVAVGSLTVVSQAVPDVLEFSVIFTCFGVAGFGYGFVMVNIYPLFLEYSGAESVGQGTGIFASSMTLAMVLTPIIAGFIIEAFGTLWNITITSTSGTVIFADYRMLTPYCTLNLVCAVILSTLIREPKKRKEIEVKHGLEVFDV